MKNQFFGHLVLSLSSTALLMGCASSGSKASGHLVDRRVIETSYQQDQQPAWLRDSRTSWDEGEQHVIRSSYTLSGNRRVNGCFDLAKTEGKEALVSEVANDIKGELVRASQGTDENVDEGITKTWIEKYQGDTRGLRFTEQAYERSVTNDVERIECFVLGRIKNSDYAQIRARILSNVVRSDDRIKKMLVDRQASMLEPENRKPASVTSTPAPVVAQPVIVPTTENQN